MQNRNIFQYQKKKIGSMKHAEKSSRWNQKNRRLNRGSALLIAMFLTMILTLLGLAFALTALTDSTITNSNRKGLSTYYVAEAGGEESINETVTTPRSQFNPNRLYDPTKYSGTIPVEVTGCYYSGSGAPACPVAVGGGSTLVNLPVTVGPGKYSVQVQYLGRSVDSLNMNLHRFLVFTTARHNTASVASFQTVANLVYLEDVEYAFPPHALSSCTEPSGSGKWLPKGVDPPGVTEVPPPPAKWPGTDDTNYGTTPLCVDSNDPKSKRVQTIFENSADYSYSSSITDSATLPPQFWKTSPTGNPPDPRTGEPYKVYVNGDLTVNGNTTIYGIYYVTGNVTLNGSAKVDGIIYAPSGTFTGKGGGNPNITDANGGVFAHNVSSTGNHYFVEWNPLYTNSHLGQLPYRISRGGR